MRQREAAAKLECAQSTLNNLPKTRASLYTNHSPGERKRKREGKSQTVNEALLLWVEQASGVNFQ